MKTKDKIKTIVEQMKKYSWDDNENDNQAALALLNSFFAEYKNIKPGETAKTKHKYPMNYLNRLFPIRNALYKREYGVACHNLYDFTVFYGLYNVRMYAVVKLLLEEYCNENNQVFEK